MKSVAVLAALTWALAGCGTSGSVSGRYLDAKGQGIPNARVTFWDYPFSLRMAPILPKRVAEAKTDANGRFQVLLKETAKGLSIEGGGGRGAVHLGWFSRHVVVEMRPYPAPDYSDINSACPHSAAQSVSVRVHGAVASPGTYTLRGSDSAWTAIETAGGIVGGAVPYVELVRRPDGHGVMIHYLDWERRGEGSRPPLLCDGDEIRVNSPYEPTLTLPADTPVKKSARLDKILSARPKNAETAHASVAPPADTGPAPAARKAHLLTLGKNGLRFSGNPLGTQSASGRLGS